MADRFAAMLVVAVASITGAGCKDSRPSDNGGARVTGPADCAGGERKGSLEWFHDDYARALACAKAKHVPLVIDMWAPWCHTCLSMQAYVLTAPELADLGRRFVFVALDTDRDVNAAPVAKFPPAAWPTFFIVGSDDESIQSRFVGAASVEQFAGFLAAHADAGSDAGLTAQERSARDGDRAASRKDWAAAEAAYRAALAPDTGWVRRPDVLVSLLQVISRQEKWQQCADTAAAHMDETGRAASASDFTAYALGCIDKLAQAGGDRDTVNGLAVKIIARLEALTADPTAPLSVDDRSDALMYLRQAHEVLAHDQQAKQAAERQRALLDEAAAKAPNAAVASTYNWPRAEVYTYLRVGLELVPALEKSAADLPTEYDPPYRLAWVYWKAGKLDLARDWAHKALALVYGPRKTRALAMLADIEKARGDAAAEKRARAEIVATWERLPAEAQNADALAKARADLAALDAPAPAPAPK